MTDKKLLLVSSSVVYKVSRGKTVWFLVKHTADGDWEIPRTNVRRGESSVRAAIRFTGEQGGMGARVLEEVGRAGGSTTLNGKIVPVRHIYYLMVQKEANEAIGFADTAWKEYGKAVKTLESKKDKEMLKAARILAKELEKARKLKNKRAITG